MIQKARKNKIVSKRVGGGLLAALLAVIPVGCADGGGNANNANRIATNTAATNTNANANANASATASDASLREAAMTLGHIEEAEAELDKAVGANDLREVRDATVKIRDSVNALPGKSAALPADKRETLNSQVREVDRLAGMLAEASDANNVDSVHQHHKAMTESLDKLKALYPAGTDMMSEGMGKMKMGKEMMDKGEMDKGMGMMGDGMHMMENGMHMMDKDMMGDDMEKMMDEGMGMMDKGKDAMNKGKATMDKEMMNKGMQMMENGMRMMEKAMEGAKKMGDQKKGMGHM